MANSQHGFNPLGLINPLLYSYDYTSMIPSVECWLVCSMCIPLLRSVNVEDTLLRTRRCEVCEGRE